MRGRVFVVAEEKACAIALSGRSELQSLLGYQASKDSLAGTRDSTQLEFGV